MQWIKWNKQWNFLDQVYLEAKHFMCGYMQKILEITFQTWALLRLNSIQ